MDTSETLYKAHGIRVGKLRSFRNAGTYIFIIVYIYGGRNNFRSGFKRKNPKGSEREPSQGKSR